MNDLKIIKPYSVADDSNSAEDELIIEQNLAQLQYIKQLKPLIKKSFKCKLFSRNDLSRNGRTN